MTSRGWRWPGINRQCTEDSRAGEPTRYSSTVVGGCHYPNNFEAVWSQCVAWMCSLSVFVSEWCKPQALGDSDIGVGVHPSCQAYCSLKGVENVRGCSWEGEGHVESI